MPGRQGRLVFAYLVSERARAVSRDELADSLWPERLPAASDVGLSAIISKLRAVLLDIGLGREALNTRSGGYELALPGGSWIDIEAALESVHLAEAALLTGNPEDAYGSAVVACAILRRQFMPGEDGAWVDGRREMLRRTRLRALDCLAQVHAANGEHTLALRTAEEAIELEPFREEGYRRLMLVHDAAGNRAEAMRVYSRLEALLRAELNTIPGPETRRVLNELTESSARSGR